MSGHLPQQHVPPTNAVAALQGEKVSIKAKRFCSGCTTYTNNYMRLEQPPSLLNEANDQNSNISKRNVVEVAQVLAKAIEECDESAMKTIFEGMENTEIIQILQCELQADFKSNAIRFVCAHLNFAVLQILLKTLSLTEKKLVIGHKGHDGLSAFHVAVERGNTDLVLKLLEQQLADPRDKIPSTTLRNDYQDTKTRPGDTALHIAKRKGDTTSLEAMQKYLPKNGSALKRKDIHDENDLSSSIDQILNGSVSFVNKVQRLVLRVVSGFVTTISAFTVKIFSFFKSPQKPQCLPPTPTIMN